MKAKWFILKALILFVFCSSVYADVIKLKAANYLPTTHPMSLLTAWFCEEVKKRTGGRVEIAYHPGGTLLSPVKMYDGVLTGIADLGFSHIQYTRGKFPVMEVFDLPLGFPSGWVNTQVCMDFYNRFKPKEFDDVQVLYLTPAGALILQTTNKPVKTLEDLKGLKIRATGQLADVYKYLGAVPVPLAMPEVYESLRRGVIDGVSVDYSTLKYWKFAEVVKYVTSTWKVGTTITFYFVMNKKKWEQIPADAQRIIMEVAHEAKERQARLWNEMDLEGIETFKAQGGQIFDLTDEEARKWIKAVEPVIADYKKSMVEKGFKASDVDGWIKFIKERIDYWKKEERARRIPSPF
ncbi:MAG: TRAP transporter substrate-binding protein [Desulfobacterota bacterium]|nr:TRAP transporter substrate-binding protein [Thermodesulfobacteriota bacterium]MDW8001232.1 TRAP transporter substrate-binding protein [Deltaproteobacteria bacterium]